MNFLFCSGTATRRYVVLLGLMVGSNERHIISRNWKQFLNECDDSTAKRLRECHSRQRSEHDIWKAHYHDGDDSPIQRVFEWFLETGLTVTFSAVDRDEYQWRKRRWEVPRGIGSEWESTVLQLGLAMQQADQPGPEAGRVTQFLIDDRIRPSITGFERLIGDTPSWALDRCEDKGSATGLSHVVAAPLFAPVEHSELLRLPYFLATILRRYAEMQANETLGTSIEEVEKVDDWFNAIADHCVAYPYQCEVHRGAEGLFRALAPFSMRRSGSERTRHSPRGITPPGPKPTRPSAELSDFANR